MRFPHHERDKLDTAHREAPRARLWPVALLFAVFASLPSACHWPYPDPRQPVIEADGAPAPAEGSVAQSATAAKNDSAEH